MKTEMNLKKDYSDIVLFQFCFTRASRLKLSTKTMVYTSTLPAVKTKAGQSMLQN